MGRLFLILTYLLGIGSLFGGFALTTVSLNLTTSSYETNLILQMLLCTSLIFVGFLILSQLKKMGKFE